MILGGAVALAIVLPVAAHDGAHDGPRTQLFVAILQESQCEMSGGDVAAKLERFRYKRGEIRRIVGELIQEGRAERNSSWTKVRLLGDDCL